MFDKYNFKPLVLVKNSFKKYQGSLPDLIDNPNNVLIVSLDKNNVERFADRLNKFNFQEFNIHLIQPGTLEDDTNKFQLLNEIFSECKCKVFILQNEFSDLKYFFQAADIANFYANIHLIHSSLIRLEQYFSNFNSKSFRSILNISVSGYQQHLSENATIPNSFIDNYRLGNIIQQIEVINKPIQYSDCAIVHISALKQADLPSKTEVGASGLSSEMFNQVARAIGSSERTRITVMTGFSELDEEMDNLSVDTVSQFIYYYLSGANKKESSHSNGPETTFIIDECLPYQRINFTKNEINMEWYANYPYELPSPIAHLAKIPCTYNDYLYSGQGELSPRLTEIFQWLDGLRQKSF